MHCGHCPQAPPPQPSWWNLFNVRDPCRQYAIFSQICSDQHVMSFHPSVNDYLETSPVARGQPPLPPLAAHSFQRAKVDGPLLSVCQSNINMCDVEAPNSTFVGNIWVLDLASKFRMAIPALNSSVGSRGSLRSISDITSLNSLLEILTLLEALTERGQTWGSGSRGRWCRGGRSTGSTRGRATLPLHSDGKGVQSKSKSTIEK